MDRPIALGFLALLTACQTETPVNTAAARAAQEFWGRCVFFLARDLADTSRESPDMIAIAAMSNCSSQEENYFSHYQDLIGTNFRSSVRRGMADHAIALVVNRRARTRSP